MSIKITNIRKKDYGFYVTRKKERAKEACRNYKSKGFKHCRFYYNKRFGYVLKYYKDDKSEKKLRKEIKKW